MHIPGQGCGICRAAPLLTLTGTVDVVQVSRADPLSPLSIPAIQDR